MFLNAFLSIGQQVVEQGWAAVWVNSQNKGVLWVKAEYQE